MSASTAMKAAPGVAVAIEKFNRDQSVEEIRDPAWVQSEFAAELCAGESAFTERGEETELDGGEEHFRAPKAEGGLQDGIGRKRRRVHACRSNIGHLRFAIVANATGLPSLLFHFAAGCGNGLIHA